MKKQDRQGARTPADVNRRLKDVPKVASDAQKRAKNAEQEIEKVKHEKITFDRLDIDGQELNIKVAATNITGKLTADQIDAKGLTVEAANITGTLKAEKVEGIELSVDIADVKQKLTTDKLTAEQINTDGMVVQTATIGAWHLQKTDITVSPTQIISEYALYSDEIYDADSGITHRVYLTPKGVYVDGRDSAGASYFANKTWLEICGG